MEAEPYPIDVNRMQKGEFITADEVERIVLMPRTDAAYSLKVMQLITEISRMLGQRGRGMVIVQRDCGIRVLTDPEATQYLAKRQGRNVSDIVRTHCRQQLVDVSQLSDDQQAKHERDVGRSAAYVQALASTGYKRLPKNAEEISG